jgi:hypothetical protein
VSTDHSVVQELIAGGHITEEQAAAHPQRHMITRAIGFGDRGEPDVALLPVPAGNIAQQALPQFSTRATPATVVPAPPEPPGDGAARQDVLVGLPQRRLQLLDGGGRPAGEPAGRRTTASPAAAPAEVSSCYRICASPSSSGTALRFRSLLPCWNDIPFSSPVSTTMRSMWTRVKEGVPYPSDACHGGSISRPGGRSS